MLTKNLIKEKIKNSLPGSTGKPDSFLKRHAAVGLLVFIILAILFGYLIYQRFLIIKQEQKKEAYVVLEAAKEKLQEAFTNSLLATKILSFFIDNNGAVKNFDSVAAEILSTNKNIDVLQLVPDGVIRYVYPLQGNEAVIGYNILKDTARNKEAFKAIQKRELFFSGPFELKQGGFGIVGRLPVFRNGKFWGFSAVVIKMTTLLNAAEIDRTAKSGYYYQLSKINPDTKKEEFFIPQVKTPLKNYLFSLDMPIGDWKLSVEPVDVNKSLPEIYILALIGLLVSIFGGIFVFGIIRRPEKLERLVKERTRALKGSENKYRSVIDRVSDAFVSLDKDWNYTFVNNKAGEIFARKPEKLIGKNIWTEFPEGIDKPFYHAYYRAMQTQQYQYLEEYYPPYEKWFENHIYPSKDGLTIFFKDVSEIKKTSLALKENEEKYRTLIEQASDGIVITDLDGYVLEVNNSICSMNGYHAEEMLGEHLYKFLPEADAVLNPLRLKELMAGKPLLYERRLLKKDGSVLDIEVNSKMASSQTLIGFIRDITERKKNEEALRYQARLLQSVSDAITSLDMNRVIVSWNDACEELYGFTPEEAIGKRIPELVIFEYPHTNNEDVFKQVFSEGQWKGEFNFIHPKTKSKTYLLSSINVLKNQQEETIGFIITSKDITARKKIDLLLKESEEKYRTLVEQASDGIFIADKDGRFIIVNSSGCNMSQYSFEELKNLSIYDLALSEELIENPFHFSEMENNRVARAERKMKRKDGTLLDVEVTAKFISGNRFLAFVRDVSDRKKTEEEIIKSKRLFQNLVESISGVYWVTNLETYETLYISPSYEYVWGLKCSDLYKNSADFINSVHPDDKEILVDAHKNIGNTHKASITYRIIRPDGEIRWISANTNVVVDIKGNKIEYGYAEDITERNKAAEESLQSEQKYRLLFYNNPLPMWMTTIPDLDIIEVNEAAIKHYGYSRKEFLKLNAKDLRPAEDVEHFVAEVKKMKPGINNTRAWRHKKKDGTIIHVEIYSHEIFYEGQRVWLGLSNDVTEKYEAKEQLQKSYEDIRQLASNLQSIREDERTNMAREIHDELGQQLTGLKMDLHWLTRKINSTDAEVTNKMDESIELINATIASVRKISTDLRPSILDDLGLLAALEWQGEEFEKRSGTRVEFINKAGEITVQPKTATAIFRIYQELLTNIARHANASLVKTELYIEQDNLYFSLIDNGVGFEPEAIKNKKTLGLLGIKERSLLLGGTYEFKSAPGMGSVTKISIPLDFVMNTN